MSGATAIVTESSSHVQQNTWNYIVFSKSGTSVKLYVNGAQTGSDIYSSLVIQVVQTGSVDMMTLISGFMGILMISFLLIVRLTEQ